MVMVDAGGKRDSGAIFMTQTNGKASYVVVAPRRFESYVRFGVSIEPRACPGPTGSALALIASLNKIKLRRSIWRVYLPLLRRI